jgi:hypothetical protein
MISIKILEILRKEVKNWSSYKKFIQNQRTWRRTQTNSNHRPYIQLDFMDWKGKTILPKPK